MSAFPRIKLTYFAFSGRAEAPRLAFYVAGVPFIDERLTNEQFRARKPTLPLGQVPVLEVDGEVLTQSEAILRYAGRLGGLYPVNAPLEALKIDEIIHALGEFDAHFDASFQEKDPEKKKAMREELASGTIPRYAALIEARLEALHRSPIFQTKDTLFIHEILLHSWVKDIRAGVVDHIPGAIFDKYQRISEAVDKVAAHPKVKEWYSREHNALPKLKLTYLPTPGRAEAPRLALFMGGVPFEDERISYEEMVQRKNKFPFHQVPVLEVDGEVMSQSHAILRYVGALTGLYPTNDPLAAYRIDELFALMDEMSNFGGACRQVKDPEIQQMLFRQLCTVQIPKSLGAIDKRVGEWKGPHAVGATFTVADLAVYALVLHIKGGTMAGLSASVLNPFTNLTRVYDQVLAHPKVVEWNNAHAHSGP